MSCSGQQRVPRESDIFNGSSRPFGVEGSCENFPYSGDKAKISQGKDSLTDSSLRIWSLS